MTRRSTLWIFCLLLIAAGPRPAPAQTTAPAIGRDIGRYALFGRSGIDWVGALRMPKRGAVGSLIGIVDFDAYTRADGEDSFVAAPIVRAEPGTRFNHLFVRIYNPDPTVSIRHGIEYFPDPLIASTDYPSMPPVICGGASVTVDANNSPLTLAPGRYNVVTVMPDRRLELVAGGRYEMCVLSARAGATIALHADNVILLRDYLAASGRVQMIGTGACGARWLAGGQNLSPGGAGFEFGQGTGSTNRARIAGNFYTPARILMAQHNDYSGRFWGETILGDGAGTITRTLDDCTAPLCGDGNLDPGEQCDDGNNRNGDCCSSFCELLTAGNSCDDGRFCTTGDICDAAGVCRGGADPCGGADGDGNCSESCDEERDACTGPDPDGTACQDNLFCNGADRCAAGQCAWHEGSPCPGADGDANCSESCDEATDRCDARDATGTACNDGRFCTVIDRCAADGSCAGSGSPCPFTDGDGDCAESCDELADSCTAIDAEGTSCNDGMFCTAADQCDGRGFCRGAGDPCTHAGDGDTNCAESCDETLDACVAPDLDGSPCDDSIACTVGERCLGGVCAPGGTTSCDDGSPCTDEFCAPSGECLVAYNQSPCDDGNACTSGDRCNRGVCVGGDVRDCRDGDLCSADLCDPASGECRHTYAPAPDCHDLGTARTRIDVAYSPTDGEVMERLTVSWRGEGDVDPTAREELGDPTAGDSLAVCFFDESDGLPALAYRLDLAPATMNDSLWKKSWSANQLVYKLKAVSGTAQGVSQAKIVVAKNATALFKLKAGANIGCNQDCRDKFDPPSQLSDGRFFSMEPGMTMQWTSATGACWSTRHEEARANADGEFYAVTRARKR